MNYHKEDQCNDTQCTTDKAGEQSWEVFHNAIGPTSNCRSNQLHSAACGENQSKDICLTFSPSSSHGTRPLQNQPSIEESEKNEAHTHRGDQVGAEAKPGYPKPSQSFL